MVVQPAGDIKEVKQLFGEPNPLWWGNPQGPCHSFVAAGQTSPTTENWAVVNIGLLKNVATHAKACLDARRQLTSDDWTSAYIPNTCPFPLTSSPRLGGLQQ